MKSIYIKSIKFSFSYRLFMLAVLFLFSVAPACKKQDEWLDKKRANGDVVPSTLKDLQAVLDNTYVMNQNYAQIGLLSADNNYITDVNLTAATTYERNAYLWKKEIFEGNPTFDWLYAYKMVAYANIVLDGLSKIDPTVTNQLNYDNVKGSALFYRSMAFYELSQLFCKPYTKTSGTDLGIPLRLGSDVNISSTRATVQQTYDQMINDLLAAVNLLPQTPLYITRPSSVAAHALLAKIYLSKEDYVNAGAHAGWALDKVNTLIDFKNPVVSTALTYRFPVFGPGNPEIIFYASTLAYLTLDSYPSDPGYVDQNLYLSYTDNDLRKAVFYQNNGNGKLKFQGNYTGTYYNFAGLATNELYLIRAESYARAGDASQAMKDLNTLLKKRYISPYTDFSAADADDALNRVLTERRKELPYTGQLRWEDLRRLNKDPRFAKILQRSYKGVTYTLPPDDNRYVFPLPDQEIEIYGLQQNER